MVTEQKRNSFEKNWNSSTQSGTLVTKTGNSFDKFHSPDSQQATLPFLMLNNWEVLKLQKKLAKTWQFNAVNSNLKKRTYKAFLFGTLSTLPTLISKFESRFQQQSPLFVILTIPTLYFLRRSTLHQAPLCLCV